MAAKSIINELYQRLRTAAPIYKTQADDTDGFLCTLTLPAVECEFEALSTDRTFTGRGCSKKEAEHAAAIAGVELLTAEKVLRPDAPTGSHSRGTASPSVSSATSGVSLPGVGSKRSKSNADPLEEDSAESLELRILEALTAVHPKPLNGAQLAKLCGHFKLKSKVNHLLYMKLKAQGLVELLDTPVPAWRAAGRAMPAGQQAAAAAQVTQAAHAVASTPAQPAPAAAGAGNAGAAACSQDALHAGTAGQGRAGSEGLACASGAEGPAGSAVLTTSRTSDAVAGGEATGEVSSAAARLRITPSAAPASEAAGTAAPRLQGGDTLGPNTANHLKQDAAASPKAGGGHAVRGGSRGQHMSPAASPAPAIAKPSVSGGGLRGSCSPIPAAVHGRKHQQLPQQQQQQPLSSAVHANFMYGSRGAVPGAGQSDIARYRQQHMHRPQQQQSAGVLNSVVRAAWSPAGAVQQQRWTTQQPHLQQQQQSQDVAHADASLLPQTLAAVAGLGLLDPADAASLLSSAAGAAARLSSPMHAYQIATQPPISAAQQAHSASSFGRSLSHSQCSQEQHSQRLSQVLTAANKAPASLSHGGAPSAQAAADAYARSLRQCRRGDVASDSDEEVSPAVLAAANEAASLEPAPFDAERLSGSTGSFKQQQQARQQQQPLQSGLRHDQQQLQPVDLLAAMHINEPPTAEQQQQQQQLVGPCALDAVVPQSSIRGRAGGSIRAPGEAGTKRKYPAYLSEAAAAAAAAAPAAVDFMAAEGAAVAAVAVVQERGDSDRVMQDSAEQQQEQQGDQQQEEQQQQVQDVDHVHPQRRRRRSGQGDGFSGRGLGLAVAHTDPALGRSCSRGASPAEDEQTGSSDDMQDLQAGPAENTVGGVQGSYAAGMGAQQQQLQQQQEMGTAQAWPCLWQHGAGADMNGPIPGMRPSPQPAAAAAWQGAAGLGSSWPEPAAGSSGNPWQWQVQQGRPFTGTATAADSEGNGSCLSWPAAAAEAGGAVPYYQQQQQQVAGQLHGVLGVPPHQHQQQRQQQQQYACSGGFEAGRPASPAPCMSGLSVGASAVSGGRHGGSVEPLHAVASAAAGQEVTQPAPTAMRRQQQQQQSADLLQSEEQALQLLSRLALPPAGYMQGTGGVEGRTAVVPAAGGSAAAARGLTVNAAGGVSGAVAGECLTVAMAAAAAAAQAAAAVASAAGLVAAEPSPAGAAAANAVGVEQQQQGLQGGSSASKLQPTETGIACTGAQGPANAGGADVAGVEGGNATAGAAAGVGAVQELGSDVVGQTGQVGQTGLGAAGGSSLASAELQAEYERRVGAVRDLVQQLNEALQGLSSLQGQVARPTVGEGLQQQQQP